MTLSSIPSSLTLTVTTFQQYRLPLKHLCHDQRQNQKNGQQKKCENFNKHMSFLLSVAITCLVALMLTSPKEVYCQYRLGMYPGTSGSLSSLYNSRMLSLYPMAMMNPQFGSFGGLSGSSMLGGARGSYLPSSMMGGYGQQMMGMYRYPQQMIGGMSGVMPGMFGGMNGMMPGQFGGGQYGGGQYGGGQYGGGQYGGGQYGQQGGQYGQYGGSSSGGQQGQSGSSSMQTTPRYGNSQW